MKPFRCGTLVLCKHRKLTQEPFRIQGTFSISLYPSLHFLFHFLHNQWIPFEFEPYLLFWVFPFPSFGCAIEMHSQGAKRICRRILIRPAVQVTTLFSFIINYDFKASSPLSIIQPFMLLSLQAWSTFLEPFVFWFWCFVTFFLHSCYWTD